MPHDREDGDLHRRFAVLREADRASAPPFQPPVRGAPIRRLPVGWAAAAAAVLTVAGALWLTRGPESDALAALGLDLEATSWTSPTDFLLNTPGADLLRDLPTVLGADSLPGMTTELTPADSAISEDLS